MELILASASPRRREILMGMGLSDFRVVPTDFDEGSVTERHPEERVRLTAEGKALTAARFRVDALVIAADTLVYLDGLPLGKPRDTEDAAAMLKTLSGREHLVATGVAVRLGEKLRSFTEVTRVRFRSLGDDEILRYIATGEPMDKAGAYGIQGLGALFVEGIEGDFYNVMGLPACRLALCLREFGVKLL